MRLSPVKLQTQLNEPWRPRGRDTAKVGSEESIRWAELGVVPGIKQLDPEIDTLALADRKLFAQADIPIVNPGTAHDIATGIAEETGGCRHEAGGIIELKTIVPEIAVLGAI